MTHQRSTRLPPLMPGLGSEGVNKYNLLHFQAPQSPLGVPTCPGEGSSHQLNAHKCTAEPEEARQPENHCQMCSLSRALARWPNFSLAVSRLGARPHSARQHRGSRAPRPLLHMPPSSSLRSLPHFLSSLSLPPPPPKSSHLLLDHPESYSQGTPAQEHWDSTLSREAMRVATTRRRMGAHSTLASSSILMVTSWCDPLPWRVGGIFTLLPTNRIWQR